MGFGCKHLYAIPLLTAGAVALSGSWTVADGQYFGRNKVQYETFDFRVLKTAHFDIYYYPEEREAIEYAARQAERWYVRLSRLLNHEFKSRQPLILYASHPDFEQTTVLRGQIGETTGGATEILKRRMVLPFAPGLRETDHVLGHELVHAFQFDITTRSSSAVGGRIPSAAALPLWFVEGMAEYLSLGPVYPLTAMWMRDAARRGSLPTLRQLNNPKYFPYRYGHAFWAYVAGRWGDQAVGEVLKSAGQSVDPFYALTTVLRINMDSLSAQWQRATVAAYEATAESTGRPEDYGRALIQAGEGGARSLNLAPSLSPDGERLAFLSEKDRFGIELFVADARTGEIQRKILKTALDPHYESLQFINSAGAWHPEGRWFAFAGVSKGKAVISIIDAEEGGRDREYRLPEVGEIFNPTWSPDGSTIVFSAIQGGLSDLWALDTESGEARRLTSDAYADLQPTWSPDGRRIAFVTDRFSSDLVTLSIGSYRLALLDPETGRIEPVPGFEDSKNIDPHWSADGGSLYFLSDVNGITNVYRVDLEDGELSRLTNLLNGVSGITDLSPALSVAANADRLVFSAYQGSERGDAYNLYVIDDAEALQGEPAVGSLARTTPAVLPPLDRPVGDVMAMLDNPELGLPDAVQEFETSDYSAGLSLDYIAPPQVAVGADRFGTFIGGGTALFWSDLLGRHTLATLLQVNGSFEDIAAVVGYDNQRSRWNWGVVGGQVPIVTFAFSRGLATVDGETTLVEQIIRFRQINREISGVLSYPFSRVQRVEFSGRFRNITFASEVETLGTRLFDGRTVIDDTQDLPNCSDVENPDAVLCDPDALNLGTVTSALVYDNAVFGPTSALAGQRYRLEVAPTVGTLNYVSGLLDYRRYVMPFFPYTLAGRVLHFGRYGSGGEDDRLFPLFIGYQPIIRGYNQGSFEVSECESESFDRGGVFGADNVFVGENSCPQFNQLLGSKMLVTNLEFRLPLFLGLFRTRTPPGFPPLELAAFFDAGVAWWTGDMARDVGGNRSPLNPVSSYGVALRANVFGAALIELDYVHPNDRPEKGWYWQFGLTPAF